MKDSTRSPVNLGITLLGLGIAAYTATGDGVTAKFVAGLMTYLAGVAGNQTAKWFGDWFDEVPKDQQDIFRNHHLRNLITDAAALVVAKVIAKNEHPVSGTLAAAKKQIGSALNKSLGDPKSPLAEFHEFNLPDLLSGFVKKEGKVKLLTVEVWERFLDTLPAKLWPKEREDIAKALHTDFAEALWNLVKTDSASDGEAAAALEILFRYTSFRVPFHWGFN